MAEAMSDAEFARQLDEVAMSDEALAEIKEHNGEYGLGDAIEIISELLAEIDRLKEVLDANRVVRNAAESSSRTYRAVVDMLKIQRTELRDEIDRCAGLNRDLVNENAELSNEIDRLRADRPQLTDEYGLRIRHISTLTEERAIADTLDGALEVLAEFDAKGRADVVSRTLRVRKVGEWQDFEEAARG